MISEIISNVPNVMALLCLPMAFICVWAKDLILLKFELLKGKKKGAKFVVGISTDRTVRIGAETPVDNKKFVFKGDGMVEEIPIDSKRLYFAPQFGVQAALITQSTSTLFDPFSDNKVDPIDGEHIAIAIAKAKALHNYGQGWMDTKEQKLMIIVLVLVIGCGLLQFAGMSQVAELTEMLQPVVAGVQQAVAVAGEIPL